MAERIEALILDLDGVVISRPPYQLRATIDYKREGLMIYDPPTSIMSLKEGITREKLSLGNWAAFPGHMGRWVYPDVAKALPQIRREVDILGNTGRYDDPRWVWMTRLWLRLGGIPHDLFKDIHFRPKGMKTRDSKISYEAHLLEKYKRIRIVDDNPADLLPALRLFGDRVEGVLIEDRSTEFLMAEVDMRDYPNLMVVSRFRDGVQDLLPKISTITVDFG